LRWQDFTPGGLAILLMDLQQAPAPIAGCAWVLPSFWLVAPVAATGQVQFSNWALPIQVPMSMLGYGLTPVGIGQVVTLNGSMTPTEGSYLFSISVMR
jgi:hypothetical protein